MKIKVTIKQDSKAAAAVKKHMAEKKAFKKAVASGKVTAYAKSNPEYFTSPA